MDPSAFSLVGKTALVTGAGQGTASGFVTGSVLVVDGGSTTL